MLSLYFAIDPLYMVLVLDLTPLIHVWVVAESLKDGKQSQRKNSSKETS